MILGGGTRTNKYEYYYLILDEHRINLIQYRGVVIIIKRPIYPSINQRTKLPKSFSESILIFRFLEKF